MRRRLAVWGTGNWRTPLALIALLALAVRLLRQAWSPLVENDALTYLFQARFFAPLTPAALAAGCDYSSFHPLHALLLALADRLGCEPGAAGVALGIVLGAAGAPLGAILVALLARRVLGPAQEARVRRAALLAGGVLALHPAAVQTATGVVSEPLFLALWTGGLSAAWRALDSGRARWAALTGVLAALAYLTRPEGLLLLVVPAALLVLPRGGTLPRRRRATAALVLLAAAVPLAAPYAWALAERGWLLTAKTPLLAPAAPPPPVLEAPRRFRALDPATRDPLLRDLTVSAYRIPPPRPWTARVADLAGVLLAKAGFYVLAPLVLIGLWRRRTEDPPNTPKTPRGEEAGPSVGSVSSVAKNGPVSPAPPPVPASPALFLAAFAGLYLALLAVLLWKKDYVSGRHTLPLVVLAAPVIARGADRLYRGLAARVRPRAAALLAYGLVPAVLAGGALWPDPPRRAGLIDAGRAIAADWAAQDAARRPRLLVTEGCARAAYYARADENLLYLHPDLGAEALRRNADFYRPDYLVVPAAQLPAPPADRFDRLGRYPARADGDRRSYEVWRARAP